MKKSFLKSIVSCCLFLFLGLHFSYSQSYTTVDDAIANYPKSFASPEKLAEKIKADFTTEEEKARAIFTWIALNIHYDLKSYYSQSSNPQIAYSFSSEEERLNKEQKFRRDSAAKLLRTKKGVCQDYASLFHTLCELVGLKCMTIAGTSKTVLNHIGKLPKASDHAWNAVKVGETWRLIDVTWASGMANFDTGKMMQKFNDAYFFTPPAIFFLNHFPDDKRYTMTDKTAEDFAALPLYYGTYLKSGYEIITPEQGVFSLKDTQSIAFQIADLPENSLVAYVFSNDNKIVPVNFQRQENNALFEIPLTKRNRGYLTIYVNKESVVAYKIQP
jgi:transglutaminase/protease-like cytokinesis protein 3